MLAKTLKRLGLSLYHLGENIEVYGPLIYEAVEDWTIDRSIDLENAWVFVTKWLSVLITMIWTAIKEVLRVVTVLIIFLVSVTKFIKQYIEALIMSICITKYIIGVRARKAWQFRNEVLEGKLDSNYIYYDTDSIKIFKKGISGI